MDWKGSWARASIASRVETRPRRTSLRSLRSRAGSTGVHVLRLRDAELLRACVGDVGLGDALELLKIAQEQDLHLGRGRGVVHLAAERGVVVEAAHVPGHVLAHERR